MIKQREKNPTLGGIIIVFIFCMLVCGIVDVGRRTVKSINEIGFKDTAISIVERDLMEWEKE